MSLPDSLARADERAKTLAAERSALEKEMEAALSAKDEELAEAVKAVEDILVKTVEEVGIASVLDPVHDDLATLLLTSDRRTGAFALRDMFREAGLGMGSLSTNLIIPFPRKREDALDTAAAFIDTIFRVRASLGEERWFAFSAQTRFDPEFPERGWLHRFVLHSTGEKFVLLSMKEEKAFPASTTVREALAHLEAAMEEHITPVREKTEFAPTQVENAASIHDIHAARKERMNRKS